MATLLSVGGIFGSALEDQFNPTDSAAPPIVVKCVQELEERAGKLGMLKKKYCRLKRTVSYVIDASVTNQPASWGCTECVLWLVFRRKDLCEARVNSEVSSNFQTRCALRRADPPGADILWPRGELGHLFRWPLPVRWADPLVEASGGQEECYIRSSWHSHIFRWGVPSDENAIKNALDTQLVQNFR